LIIKRKMLLVFAGFFLLLFLAGLWLGYESTARRIEMMRMTSDFQAAEAALRSGKKKLASYRYKSALTSFQRNVNRGTYYPEKYSEYLTAGTICQKVRQPRLALQYYRSGLRCNPWSITLLTSLGGCAYRLGEYQTALVALEKSQSIYPLKKVLRPVLQKLRVRMREETQ